MGCSFGISPAGSQWGRSTRLDQYRSIISRPTVPTPTYSLHTLTTPLSCSTRIRRCRYESTHIYDYRYLTSIIKQTNKTKQNKIKKNQVRTFAGLKEMTSCDFTVPSAPGNVIFGHNHTDAMVCLSYNLVLFVIIMIMILFLLLYYCNMPWSMLAGSKFFHLHPFVS